MSELVELQQPASKPRIAPPSADKSDGSAAPDEVRFFQGPQSRGFEFSKAAGIFFELMRGFRTFHFLGPCVTVFGSARFGNSHPYYKLAREVGADSRVSASR
jgi:hypothetical protein